MILREVVLKSLLCETAQMAHQKLNPQYQIQNCEAIVACKQVLVETVSCSLGQVEEQVGGANQIKNAKFNI